MVYHLGKSRYLLPSPIGEGAGGRLELQRNIPHHIKACHWGKTNLRVTVLVRVTVIIEDRTVHPSAGCIMTIEDVVEVHTEDNFLQTSNVFAWTKGVAEVDIRL